MTPTPWDHRTALTNPQVGCIAGEPESYYHAVPGAVTSSRLGTLLRSPRLWYERFENIVDSTDCQSAALEFGQAYHCLCLDGKEALQKRFAICPEPIPDKVRNPGRKVWAQWKDAAGDRVVFDYETGEVLKQMRDQLMAHPVAAALIEHSQHELTWRGVDQSFEVPILFQCRTDGYADGGQKAWYGKPFIVDLKTAAEDDVRSFERSFRSARYGYHRQAAFYRGTVKLLGGASDPDFIFIRQRKDAPYEVRVFQGVATEAINYGAREIRAALEVLAYCRAHEVWPVASLELGPALDLADYIYEQDPAEALQWVKERSAAQAVNLASRAGRKPEELLA